MNGLQKKLSTGIPDICTNCPNCIAIMPIGRKPFCFLLRNEIMEGPIDARFMASPKLFNSAYDMAISEASFESDSFSPPKDCPYMLEHIVEGEE